MPNDTTTVSASVTTAAAPPQDGGFTKPAAPDDPRRDPRRDASTPSAPIAGRDALAGKPAPRTQQPSKGRVVRYLHPATKTETVELAALICAVNLDGTVNLMLICEDGTTDRRLGVELGGGPGQWQWPA